MVTLLITLLVAAGLTIALSVTYYAWITAREDVKRRNTDRDT